MISIGISIGVFIILPAILGVYVGSRTRTIEPRVYKTRKRNIKIKPDLLKAIRLGQKILY
jgi:hypothetical protein